MSSQEQMSKLLEFPYDAFLMIRLEFIQIFEDELEAKCLRIVEKYIDMERKRLYQQAMNTAGAVTGQVVDIPRDVWVSISHALFKNDLFGTVTSENTIKRAVKELVKKHILFCRYNPKKRYDATEYCINIPFLQGLLGLLPLGYQSLIPSIFDTVKTLYPQTLIPSGYQDLILSARLRVSKIDPNITVTTDNTSNNNIENVAQPANAVAQDTRDMQKTENEDEGRDHDTDSTGISHAADSTLDGGLPLSGAAAVADSHTGGSTDVGSVPAPKRSRKPKITDAEKARRAKEAAEEQSRVADVFTAFDGLAREMYRDPDFSYDRSKVATEAIRQFLTLAPRPTLAKLRARYVELFNKPRGHDGFCWQDNMSIAAVCREYGRKPVLLAAKQSAAPVPGEKFIPEETELMVKLRLMREQYGPPKALATTGGR